MRGWRRDLRDTIRSISGHAGLSGLAILILALGVAAASAIFSVVNGVLLTALPYEAPDRIVSVHAENSADGSSGTLRVVEVQAFEERAEGLEQVGGVFPLDLTYLNTEGEASRVAGAMVTAGYFDVFGVAAWRGRLFTREEANGGTERVAVLSHGFWLTELGGPEDLPPAIMLGGEPFAVVGVLPPGHRPPLGTPDIYIPYRLGTQGWIGRWLHTFALLRPAVSPEAAQDEMSKLIAGLGPGEVRSVGWKAAVVPLSDDVVGEARTTIWLLAAAVGLVLTIACANVASLLLARASTRRREIGVRLALGARWWEVVRPVLLEGMAVAGFGGVVGMGLAFLGVRALVAAAPPQLPRVEEISVNSAVLGTALLLSLVSGLVAAATPAIYAARAHPAVSLGIGGRGETRCRRLHRALGVFAGTQIALTVALLMTAGLVLRSFAEVLDVDTGFNAETTVAMALTPPASKYEAGSDVLRYFERVRERVAGLGGVTGVGIGSHLPLSGRASWMAVNSRERWVAGTRERIPALQRVAHPSFFATLGIPVREGRLFDERDRPEVPQPVIINATLARRLWPDGRAVGRRMTTVRNPTEDDWMEVVGVVGDVRYQEMDAEPEPQVYELHAATGWRSMYIFARGTLPVAQLAAEVRQAIRTFDPAVPISGETTLAAVVDHAVAGRRFAVWLFGLFGVVALLLSLSGIYGVLSFTVSQRRREMGIRLALGARSANVLTLVLRRSLAWLGIGLAGGFALASAAAGGVRGLLYGVAPGDPTTGVFVTLILSGTVLLASAGPARRAGRVDPMSVLRDDD